MKNNLKIILFYIVLIAVILIVLSQMFSQTPQEVLQYSDIVHYFEEDAVIEFYVSEKYYLEMEDLT